MDTNACTSMIFTYTSKKSNDDGRARLSWHKSKNMKCVNLGVKYY